MNGHFMGFRQLVQKLEQKTPIISTLQDRQNELSFYGFSATASYKLTNLIIRIHSYLSNQEVKVFCWGTNLAKT